MAYLAPSHPSKNKQLSEFFQIRFLGVGFGSTNTNVSSLFVPGIWLKGARQEPSTRFDDTRHPTTSNKLGHVGNSLEFDRNPRQ